MSRSSDGKYYIIFGAQMVNKGAQAMLFNTISEIRLRDENAKIIVFVYKKWKSEESQDLYNVKFVPINMQQMVNLTKGFLSKAYILVKRARIKRNSAKLAEIDYILRNTKMAFDISGYALSDQWGVGGSLFFLQKFAMLHQYNIPTYVLPQSFGPFNYGAGWKNAFVKYYTKKYLGYAAKVFAREQEGLDCLTNEVGLTNVELSTDLVLQSKGVDTKLIYRSTPKLRSYDIKKNSVAIIPNSSNNKYGDKAQILNLYHDVIEKLLLHDKNIYLIAHSSQDFEMCDEIRKPFRDNDRVEIIQADLNCIEYGGVIRNFDYAIASRFHSIVNAYKEHIPCIALGWATKYQDLLDLLGQGQFNFDVRKLDGSNEFLLAIEKMNSSFEEQSKMILQKLADIQSHSCYDFLDDVIGKKTTDASNHRSTVRTVADVVNEDLCSGCGICKAVCPCDCIEYKRDSGLYSPVIDSDKCVKCGKCFQACPGKGYDYAEQWQISKIPENIFFGNYLSCHSVQTKDKEILKNATSGGCITTIVKLLLDDERYDSAFLVKDDSFSEQIFTERYDSGDIAGTTKSRYVPVAQTKAVEYMLNNRDKKLILVGTACHVHGILNVIKMNKLNRDNYLILGLFCDRTMSYDIWDFLNHSYGDNQLSALYFRDKQNGGWPGNLTCTDKSDKRIELPLYVRTSVKDYFQLQSCMYCYDKLNQFADISFGDDYYNREKAKEVGGLGSVIIRTERGKSVWNSLSDSFICSEQTADEIIQSQSIKQRKANFTNNRLHCSMVECNTGFNDIVSSRDAVTLYDSKLEKMKLGKSGDHKQVLSKATAEYKQSKTLIFRVKRKIKSKLGV